MTDNEKRLLKGTLTFIKALKSRIEQIYETVDVDEVLLELENQEVPDPSPPSSGGSGKVLFFPIN